MRCKCTSSPAAKVTQNCSKTRCRTKTTQKNENGVEKTPSPPPLAERLLRSVTTGIIIMSSMSVPQQQVVQQRSRHPENQLIMNWNHIKILIRPLFIRALSSSHFLSPIAAFHYICFIWLAVLTIITSPLLLRCIWSRMQSWVLQPSTRQCACFLLHKFRPK